MSGRQGSGGERPEAACEPDSPTAIAYPLAGVRVLELGEELCEFAGKLLAGAGASVLKIEPPGGQRTRRNGPFYQDLPGPGRSLYFWHYNLAKSSLTLDPDSADGRAILQALVAEADVVLTGYDPPVLDRLRLYPDEFSAPNSLIWAAITPFGLEGPYRNWAHSDLVQLAMGGQAMVCGYDPVRWEGGDAQPVWDTPPIAPQMWHSYHVVGNYAYIAVLAALVDRQQSGLGQRIEVPVHAALDTCTEMAQPVYLYSGRIVRRQTARMAAVEPSPPDLRRCAHGRLLLGSTTFMLGGELEHVQRMLEAAGVEVDPYVPLDESVNAFAAARTAEEAFHTAQAGGIYWAPVRAPEENLADPHFRERGVFAAVEHPKRGVALTYPARPWLSSATAWRDGPRAPLPGEHNAEVLLGQLGLSRRQFLTLAQAGVI